MNDYPEMENEKGEGIVRDTENGRRKAEDKKRKALECKAESRTLRIRHNESQSSSV